MLQYVEFEKQFTEDERHYYFTPPEGIEMVNDYQVAALVVNGVQVAAVNREDNYLSQDFWWTEVCQDKGEFAVAVALPPSIEGGWKRNEKFYEKYLQAISGNKDCLYWISMFTHLGVNIDSLAITSLLSKKVVPYPLEEDLSELKRLACFIGVEKMVTLVTKTTYEGVEGEAVRVDETLIRNCCAYYRNLRHLGHTALGKTVRYRDWRKVYRVLSEWYQEVYPAPAIDEEEKVEFSISPQQMADDGIVIEGYTLRIPKTGGELIQWGEWMGNCLIHYTEKVCQGIIVVGVFSNDSIFYALEIENGFLVQFRGLSNLVNPGLALKDRILDVLGEAGLLNLVQNKRERKRYLFPNPDYKYRPGAVTVPTQEEIDFLWAGYYNE